MERYAQQLCLYRIGESMHGYMLKVYTRRTEEVPLWSKRDDSPARPVR